jgi:hypothetical protein
LVSKNKLSDQCDPGGPPTETNKLNAWNLSEEGRFPLQITEVTGVAVILGYGANDNRHSVVFQCSGMKLIDYNEIVKNNRY